MKHLAYSHQVNIPLAVAIATGVRRLLPGPLRAPIVPAGPGRIRSRVLVCIGWLLVLVVQTALILVVREVIELCHGVIGLYLDLAKLQLDLTSQYAAVTTPK